MRPHRWQPTRLPRPWDSPGKNTGVGCHFLPQCVKVKSENEAAQSCPTLSDPMDCSLPGSSVHGIFQARVLEWGAIAFSVHESEITGYDSRYITSSCEYSRGLQPWVYAPTTNAEEAEFEWFYHDLQDLLELTPKKDVLFITGGWNSKVVSQEILGVTGKFGLGVQNETGQRLIEFYQENALVIANTLFQQHKRQL